MLSVSKHISQIEISDRSLPASAASDLRRFSRVTISLSISRPDQRQGRSQKGHILAEVDHLGLPLLRIFNLPEIVHEGRNSGQETSHGRRTQLRLYAKYETGATQA